MNDLKKIIAITGISLLGYFGMSQFEKTKEMAPIPALMGVLAAGSYHLSEKQKRDKKNKKRKEYQENFMERYFNEYGMVINEEIDQNNLGMDLIKIGKLKVYDLSKYPRDIKN